MKRAVIEMTSMVLPHISVLADAGLSVVGSLDCQHCDTVRLLIEEAWLNGVLPAECEDGVLRPGIPVVSIVFEQQAYGSQRLVKVKDVTVGGYLTRERVIVPAGQPSELHFERAAAEARSAAILGALSDREPA
ncbi:hypothetical protein [Bradyrhizobium sp. SRS-191]|uniref:hypothetical protein n=1 Tax=Bradyrhizobium sp. SRS-191 TaxID=2962606 RepID=UPI00211E39AC|nr:hypothetical protein [Bradyrhizobium sp. SRS-191]